MSRSIWKGKFVNTTVSFKKTQSRNDTISSSLIGRSVQVYNGNKFKTVFITRDKVGFHYGQFSFTRKNGKKKEKFLKTNKK